MLSLAVFSTTKGNHHQTDIYREVLRDLSSQIDLDFFSQKIAHIKDGGESDSYPMELEFSKYNFNDILITKGKYKHFDQSHFTEFEKDINTVVNQISQPYFLFVEADWVFRLGAAKRFDDLKQYFIESVEILEQNKNIQCVRFPHNLDDDQTFNSVKIKSSTLKRNNYLYSFNPHIGRTQSLFNVCNLLYKIGNQLSPHIEWKFTQGFQLISKEFPFMNYSVQDIRARHIGVPDWKTELNNINSEHK